MQRHMSVPFIYVIKCAINILGWTKNSRNNPSQKETHHLFIYQALQNTIQCFSIRNIILKIDPQYCHLNYLQTWKNQTRQYMQSEKYFNSGEVYEIELKKIYIFIYISFWPFGFDVCQKMNMLRPAVLNKFLFREYFVGFITIICGIILNAIFFCCNLLNLNIRGLFAKYLL